MKTGFYAYPSQPTGLAYTIQTAIEMINESDYPIQITPWQSMRSHGRFILSEIVDQINQTDVFMCDLTFTNNNVLFELGYALASDKPIWLSLNNTYSEDTWTTKTVDLISTIQYRTYQNAEGLFAHFLTDKPYQDDGHQLFQDVWDAIRGIPRQSPSILHLKCAVSTPESLELTRRLGKAELPVVTDNIGEVSRRPFEWYIDNIERARGVVAHFLGTDRKQAHVRNSLYSLLCGIAYGTGSELLMLAHSPYEPEIDFKDLMHVHESPEQVVHIVDEWLARIHEQKKTLSPSGKEQQKQRRALQRIHLGEYVAEDEKLELPNYFIETGVFNNALATSQYMIYVGRKGTGKTANLFSIAERLVSDIRENNLVCVIRPEDWELEGVYKLYQLSLSRSEIGYLVESLWKYLIFTELANTIYISLYRKAVGMRTESENYFCDFIDSHYHLVSSDFETRLTNALNELCQIDTSGPAAEKKQKVSEILHDGMLSRLRELLGQVMETKGKVFVLVDNLDKTWFERDDLGILSEFLFGLLNVGQELPSRFARRDSRLKQISLTLIIFLRSDIYSHMVALARERGKLKIQQINWDDEILLLRLIEERFRSSLGEELSPEEIWGRFFAEEVDGIPTMQYLTRRIIPRPRDMIVFCKQAHLNAVNHGHHRIEATDIKQAEYVYSRHAFNEFVDETKARFPMVEDLAYELAGANRIIEREFLENCIARVGYPPGNAQDVISLLTDATFLGLEIRENEFAYIYDPQRKGVLKTLAVKCAEDSGVERFEINYPFRLFLEIKE